MITLLQDLRYAARMLLKSPSFAAIAIFTLALGIAANTALFSIVNGVLLNPLPFPHPGQLVALYGKSTGFDRAPIAYLNFLDWQRDTQTVSSMAMYHGEDYNLTGRGETERVSGYMISADFFSTLGVKPSLGRSARRRPSGCGARRDSRRRFLETRIWIVRCRRAIDHLEWYVVHDCGRRSSELHVLRTAA